MRQTIMRSVLVTIVIVGLGIVIASLLACASSEPTATPAAPAQPAAPVAPTAAPAPTTSASPATPTAAPAVATPTRALPTATPAPSGGPVSGGVLRHATLIQFDTLDAHLTNRVELYSITYSIYDNLVQLAQDGTIQPDLAQSWTVSADGKTITFKLNSGVKFHDGTDFNAEAVKWNIERILKPETGSPQRTNLAPSIDKVVVVDNDTVALNLKQPSRPFLAFLTDRAGYMVSPTAVAKLGADFGVRPVGTGPFKLTKWLLGDSNSLEKNPNYWQKGKPYLDKVVIQDVPDITVQLAMVRTGESDMITYITPASVRVAEGNPNLKLYPLLGRNPSFFMNYAVPPYNNKSLRQAFAYSFNRQELFESYYEKRGQIAYSIAPPGTWAYSSDLKVYDLDLTKAKQKLAEAGYPNGGTFSIGCGSDAADILRCEIFQAQLSKAGIKADLKVVRQADYFAALRREWKGDRILAGYWQYTPRADPHQTIQGAWHTGGFLNSVPDYSNPDVDKLIDQAEGIYDTAKAKAIYDQVQKIVLEDAVMVPLVFPPEYTVMSTKIQGLVQPIDFRPRLRSVWFAR